MKKLTITVTPEVYRGLRKKIGPGKISSFIDRLARPHVLPPLSPAALEAAYREMAADELAEAEANEWADGTAGSALDQSD
ncbi:MAG: hypothetical protein SFV19_03205 [Rhodospirillaceae bacterium]|nr:hypothetical protein [Rhodospirillaceae bacterium]